MKSTIALGLTGMLTALGGAVALSSGTGCTPAQVNATQVVANGASVAGFSGDQLTNAAAIINAATGMGLGAQAQAIGVMTAIGESGLRNLNHGDEGDGVTNPDGSATTSLGLFQQQQWWGSTAERMDPSRAAAKFFGQLIQIPDWQKLTPTAAAHVVQANADPDFYTPFVAPAAAIVATLSAGSTTQGCGVPADAQALALELVTHLDAGTLVGLEQPPIEQIRWAAAGTVVPDCGIDVRTLQIMVLAVRNFDRVGVSSLNRKCTGDLIGGGLQGPHYRDGGGGAVDFYMLDDRNLTGADGLSLRLIGLLDPVVPDGARIGQSNCRAAGGVRLQLQHFGEFADTCHHLHVDVARTDGQLNFPS
ncbi:MAG: hypothetical protein ACOH10_00135 [Rhodoglobus sp.]